MTTEQPTNNTPATSYNPFHHLTMLRYPYWEGDPFLRLVLFDLIKQNNLTFTGPYANALETTSLSAQILLAVYDELFPDGMNENEDNQSAAGRIANLIMFAVGRHVTTEAMTNTERWIPDLSLADQRSVLSAIKGAWTEQEKKLFSVHPREWTVEAKEIAGRPGRTGMSAHFTVNPFGNAVIHMAEGGLNHIPERERFLSRMSGPYHMTWKACQEWGYKLIKTPGFPDSTEVYVNITFNNPPKAITIVATSSTDDVPDPDKPGEMKSEQLVIKMSKGKNNRSRSLTARDLKYHDWVFTVEDTRTP